MNKIKICCEWMRLSVEKGLIEVAKDFNGYTVISYKIMNIVDYYQDFKCPYCNTSIEILIEDKVNADIHKKSLETELLELKIKVDNITYYLEKLRN